MEGHKAVVRLLLEHEANVDGKDDRGNTPLHYACKNGRTAMARWLVENGASIHFQNDEGFTPLHYACDNGRETVT
jgi:ankyrin repeat protein